MKEPVLVYKSEYKKHIKVQSLTNQSKAKIAADKLNSLFKS